MSKPKTKRALKDNEAKAVLRMLRTSGQKLNLVAAMIRGKKVDKALAELTFSRKRIAGAVKKTLERAPSPTLKTIMGSTPTPWWLRKPMSATR